MEKTLWRGRWGLAAVGLAGMMLAAAGAQAADTPGGDPRGGRDQAIVRQLHSQNQDAIAAAQIAEQRATRDDVRAFATQVIAERQASDAQLLAFAQGEGMNMPDVDTGAAALPHGPLATARLNTAPPERFDNEFASFMNAQAQADVDQATKAQQLAFRPALQGMIQNSILPRLAGQEAGSTALASTLPVLPPQVLQQPGGFPYPSWTTTGNDQPPPGVLR